MREKKERLEPDDIRKNPNNMNIKCLSNEQMRVIMIEKSVVTLLSFWNYKTLYGYPFFLSMIIYVYDSSEKFNFIF